MTDRQSRARRWAGTLTTGILLTSLLAAAPASKRAVDCVPEKISVALAAGGPSDQTVAGWLCRADNRTRGVVYVVVPGTTYTHTYWDSPRERDIYSFVQAMVNPGISVYLYDRLGTGASTYPDAADTTLDAHAFVLEQLVRRLREDGFHQVVTVGHSQGSLIAMHHATVYTNVDGLIPTGWLHEFANAEGAVATIAALTYPAQADPRFGSSVPPGYVTTIPGTRGHAFYAEDHADPAMVAFDEATKDIAALTEVYTAGAGDGATQEIHVPVLTVVGELDAVFCLREMPCGAPGSPTDSEPAYWSPRACWELFVLADSGHSINWHPNSHDWYAAARDWTERRVGGGSVGPLEPCEASA